MKLTFSQIQSFLQKPDPSIRIILFYGPDAGLVHERADAMAKKFVPETNDPFRVTHLSSANITDDPARLHDELATPALGGGTRLVRIAQAIEGISLSLNALLDNEISYDSKVLIEAGDLEKRSKLRAACESAPHAVAIPCYIEDGQALEKTVASTLKVEGMTVPHDVLLFLCSVLPPDRLALRSELEKLILYTKGQKTISIEDVKAVIEDARAAELDDLVFAVAGGDPARALKLLDHLHSEHTPSVTIVRAAQRHFLRLEWARYQMDCGSSASEAIKKLQPPVFWKLEDQMIRQLNRWPMTKINRALHALVETEATIKKTGVNDSVLSAHTLLAMASA